MSGRRNRFKPPGLRNRNERDRAAREPKRTGDAARTCASSPLTLNQRVPGSSPGAPTTSALSALEFSRSAPFRFRSFASRRENFCSERSFRLLTGRAIELGDRRACAPSLVGVLAHHRHGLAPDELADGARADPKPWLEHSPDYGSAQPSSDYRLMRSASSVGSAQGTRANALRSRTTVVRPKANARKSRQHMSRANIRVVLIVAAIIAGATGCEVRPPPGQFGQTPTVAPPPSRVEVVPPPPASTMVWVPGHWQWNGQNYAWESGHYIARPSDQAEYEPGHWVQTAGTWTWVPGQWR